MGGPQDLVWQTTMEAAEEATRNATRSLLNNNSNHSNLPLIQLLPRDPYQDLSIEVPPHQTGESSRSFHRPTPDEDPIIKFYQTEHLTILEAIGILEEEKLRRMTARVCVLRARVRVLEQNQERGKSTLLALKTERDNAQVQLVNFRTSMVKNRLAHTTGRYPNHP